MQRWWSSDQDSVTNTETRLEPPHDQCMCVSLRSECGPAVCSLRQGGLSLCVQPGVCERGRGLGAERTQSAFLQRRTQQLLQRGGGLEVRHCQVLPLLPHYCNTAIRLLQYYHKTTAIQPPHYCSIEILLPHCRNTTIILLQLY